MNSCRLIIDPPLPGAWNMALDEALLESAQNDGTATLRFYSWREPTLSLGYFQAHADRQLHAGSAGCALVRRASGGGAILHDRELTYSVALPLAHPLAARAEKLYQAVHQSLIEILAEFGAAAMLCENSTAKATQPVSKPFLCFQRRESGDVLLAGHKIAGSAQRRQRGAVLQHGSVLWACSKFAPELPGVADIIDSARKTVPGKLGEIQELFKRWPPRLAERLEMGIRAEELSDSLICAAREIEQRKFGDQAWTTRR